MQQHSALSILTASALPVPKLIAAAGDSATRRFLEFFTARIRNKGTRAAYGNTVAQFCAWCEQHKIEFLDIEPIIVATYIESLTQQLSAPTVKLHLSAIRMLFDFLVIGQIMHFNPAASVRGPKHVVKKGKTPVLTGQEARQLIDSIETGTIAGLRDRALIGVLVYSFARVSAALGMDIEDYYPQGRRMWFRLREKGGKHHEVPAHHKAVDYVDAYVEAAGRTDRKKLPLFCTVSPGELLTETRLHRSNVLRMIKRRAQMSGLAADVCCHTFRATGITVYLENGGSLEHAQRIAAHESARTTKLYDRTADAVSLDEIEKISF